MLKSRIPSHFFPIFIFRIDWDTSPSFSNANSRSMQVSPGSGPFFCYDIDIPSTSSLVPRYARVSAYNGFAWSQPQYPIPSYAVGAVGAPGAPIAVTTVPTSNYGILASWQPPSAHQCVYGGDGGSPVTQYVLEWDTRVDFGSPASKVSLYGSDSLSYEIGGRNMMTGVAQTVLQANTSYFVRVTAFNGQGAGVAGYPAANPVTTFDQIPDAPANVVLTNDNVTSLNVAWQPSPRDGGVTLEKYRVEFSTNASFGSYEAVDLPIVPEVQTVVAETPVAVETQAIRVLTQVTNER